MTGGIAVNCVQVDIGHLCRRLKDRLAQRAARMMARSGQVRLAHVRVPTIRGRRSAEWVVIGRAEVDPGTITDEAMQTAAIRRVAPADRTKEALDSHPLRDVDLDDLRARHAGRPAHTGQGRP